jgi:hypothetical protein
MTNEYLDYEVYVPKNAEDAAKEILKCRENFFYFLYNYVYIDVTGEKLKITPDNLNYKMKRMIKCAFKFENVVLNASRQEGKTTTIAIIFLWCLVFFKKYKAMIISYKKDAVKDIIDRLKYCHSLLPEWMLDITGAKLTTKGTQVLNLYFNNHSTIRALYPSSQTPSNTLGRGISAPGLYVDEVGFIKDFGAILGSAIPALSKAASDARKNGYPTFTILSSTPNGKMGVGKDWFDLYSNTFDSDLVFEKNETDTIIEGNTHFLPGAKELYESSGAGYIRVDYYWYMNKIKNPHALTAPEDIDKLPYKIEMIKKLPDKEVQFAQEFDLVFLSGTSHIFPSSFMAKIKPRPIIETIKCPHLALFNIYKKFSQDDFYLIGVDSAKSLIGDNACIQVFQYSTFEQVGEYIGKEGALYKVSDILKHIIQHIERLTNGRIIVIIESNAGFGAAVIENLERDSEVEYTKYLYSDKPNQYGIQTNAINRDYMISHMYELFTSDPSVISSKTLISELSTLERRPSGKIEAGSGYHDDAVMASSFCAYVRAKTALRYMPLITNTRNTELQRNEVINDTLRFNIIDENINYMPKYNDVYVDPNEDEDQFQDSGLDSYFLSF